MLVAPMGDASYTEGLEEGQYELTVNGKETGIYFMAADYATWLEEQIDKFIKVPGNVEKTSKVLDFVYERLKQVNNEGVEFMCALSRIIDNIKYHEYA